jgi:sugar O-acyltransferase (sialic acid O-acetyltransferase NeuD family)
MTDIVIYGAGGFGRETALMINQINERVQEWRVLGFYDDNKRKGEEIDGYPVLGGLNDLNEAGGVGVVLAVADPIIRKRLRATIINSHVFFPVLIHPSVNKGDVIRNTIGEGTIITAGNILTTNIHLGAFTIVNLACTIGHDVVVGRFSSIMPSCSLSGFIQVGEGVLIGSGARILPGLTIGNAARIGAGAVVTRSVPEGITVVGVPARGQEEPVV